MYVSNYKSLACIVIEISMLKKKKCKNLFKKYNFYNFQQNILPSISSNREKYMLSINV